MGANWGSVATVPAMCAEMKSKRLFVRQDVLSLGDVSSLRAVVNGTARLGQGVRREAESEGSRDRFEKFDCCVCFEDVVESFHHENRGTNI